MQSCSRRNAWCDIFEGRTGNKDLGRFSPAWCACALHRHVLRDKRLWSCIDIDSNSIPRTCCQLVSPLRDILGIFPGSEYTYTFTAPACSLARSARVPLRVLRDSTLCHTFRLPTLPWEESRYIDTFEESRRHRLDFRNALSRGKVLLLGVVDSIFFRETRSIFPYTRKAARNSLLEPHKSDRIAKFELTFKICETNWRDNGGQLWGTYSFSTYVEYTVWMGQTN